MKIDKILSQNRRDMVVEMICENCGEIEKRNAYDDDHFHKNVIPSLVCKKCNKKSPEDYRPLSTKYNEFQIV